MTALVIIGCGGFGREVWSIAKAINRVRPTFELLGFVDDAPAPYHQAALERIQAPLLGGLDWLHDAGSEVQAVIGIGSARDRRFLDCRFPDQEWATLVHPDTTIGLDVRFWPGGVVAPGTRVSTAVTVGRHAHLDQNVTVGHDCTLGDYSRCNPQACVSGQVTVGNAAIVGANATVLPGLTVGDGALVGAGGVAVRSIQTDMTVKGVPAR